MQQIQQLMIQMQMNQTGGGGKKCNLNTHTHQTLTEPRQGQPYITYQTLPTNVSGHMGSVHIEDQRAAIKCPITRTQKASPTSAVEAHMGAPDNGG